MVNPPQLSLHELRANLTPLPYTGDYGVDYIVMRGEPTYQQAATAAAGCLLYKITETPSILIHKIKPLYFYS